MEIRNIIFDWDHTLFPFSQYWERAHKQAFFDFKYDTLLSFSDFIKTYRRYDQDLWPLVAQGEMTLDELRVLRLVKAMEEHNYIVSPEEAKRFFNHFFSTLLQLIEPEPFLLEQVLSLQQHYQLAILTNGKISEQREKIKRAGFEGIMPVYISEEMGLEKPDLAAFQYVLAKEKFQVKHTLMVGDSLTNDILPAKELGLQTAYIGKEQTKESELTFLSIQELCDYLLKDT
ncbi:HAD family hydrolase [Streptococcus massiliensis]|uniref:Haloacid dehalogenase n=1 Tax=Streptococcus massiliensis TaxID=313439 RepID=A0A380KXY8_9STRE|nr:HAD family hydrolase [Streptococcus massiliensis]SUN75987.1 haloacid dehalogenase [Streptococcus massiliensis]